MDPKWKEPPWGHHKSPILRNHQFLVGLEPWNFMTFRILGMSLSSIFQRLLKLSTRFVISASRQATLSSSGVWVAPMEEAIQKPDVN